VLNLDIPHFLVNVIKLKTIKVCGIFQKQQPSKRTCHEESLRTAELHREKYFYKKTNLCVLCAFSVQLCENVFCPYCQQGDIWFKWKKPVARSTAENHEATQSKYFYKKQTFVCFVPSLCSSVKMFFYPYCQQGDIWFKWKKPVARSTAENHEATQSKYFYK